MRHHVIRSRCCVFYAFSMLTYIAFPCRAGSLYIGHSQSEQISTLGNTTLQFDPSGQTVSFSFDVTEALTLSADYTSLDDEVQPAERVTGRYEIDNWQAGIHYALKDWSFALNYSNWQDDLDLAARTRNPSRVVQFTDADSMGISVGYDWYKDSWQWGVSGGLHYNDWEQGEAIGRPDMLPRSALDSGNSTFVSVNVSGAYLVSLANDRALLMGAGVGYNQVTNSESTAIARNGRNISQINALRGSNQLSTQNVIGSESYGLVSAFLSYEFATDWVLDVDASFDFGGQESTTAWSVNLGYLF